MFTTGGKNAAAGGKSAAAVVKCNSNLNKEEIMANKKLFWRILAAALVCAAFLTSCPLEQVTEEPEPPATEEPNPPIPDGGTGVTDGKTLWKVLWAICPYVEGYEDMTDERIEIAKAQTIKFEEFIEAHSNGKLDIQITIDVLQNPVTRFKQTSIDAPNGVIMPQADYDRLRPLDNFDSVIYTAYPRWDIKKWPGGMGIYQGGIEMTLCGGVGYTTYVHEWCHQLERLYGYYLPFVFFPATGDLFQMPELHSYMEVNDNKYIDKLAPEIGFYDAELKWYGDYIQGTIDHVLGATELDGVHADWWPYHPLAIKDYGSYIGFDVSEIKTTFWNETSWWNGPSKFSITFDEPVTGQGEQIIDLLTGHFLNTAELIGTYVVLSPVLSADKKTLTIDLGADMRNIKTGEIGPPPLKLERGGKHYWINGGLGRENPANPALWFKGSYWRHQFDTHNFYGWWDL
jgi:hypothetical protein